MNSFPDFWLPGTPYVDMRRPMPHNPYELKLGWWLEPSIDSDDTVLFTIEEQVEEEWLYIDQVYSSQMYAKW